MPDLYRLSWEMVKQSDLRLFSNADPRYYSNTTQIVPNSEIPDEHWDSISTESADPWDQYKTLCEWATEDREFVRNVKLEKRLDEPTWEEVK
jgi:hypothetical protein